MGASVVDPQTMSLGLLVVRTVHAEVPPRVEYALTELGTTLRQLVRGLVEWSGAHLAKVDAARAAYDARHAG